MSDAVVVIPARFASTRLPGKPLIDLGGMPMIAHVVHRALMVEGVSEVIVATDSPDVASAACTAGARAVMTDPDIENGTLRVASVFEGRWDTAPPFIAQVNGDEPLIPPANIAAGIGALRRGEGDATVLVYPTERGDDRTEFKAVLNWRRDVMYMSREPIPSNARGAVPRYWKCSFVTSYLKEVLRTYPTLPVPEVERIESSNELRLIASGYRLTAVTVGQGSMSVDVPADAERARHLLRTDPLFAKYGVLGS